MPDDDWALGQNEVDVRNEARKPANAMPTVYSCTNPESAWIDDVREQDSLDLWQALDHLGRLLETPAINPDAEERRHESIARAREEIARLMQDGEA